MKKRLMSISVVVIFMGLIFGAQRISNQMAGMDVAESTEREQKVSAELYQPDIERLDYYGIGAFETALPVVHINTGGQQVKKSTKIWADLGVLKPDKADEKRSIREVPDQSFPITLSLRGASSYVGFDKNQYRLEFYEEMGDTRSLDYDFLGMAEHSEWVLHGPYLDVSLMRNHLLYKLARELFEWAPDSRYCEVFVDGQYQGLYLAVEPVTNGRNRLNLSRFGLLTGETSYIVHRDRVDTKEYPLETYGMTAGKTYNSVYISYPSYQSITPSQRDWIQRDINQFEKALYSEDFADEEKGYKAYIDFQNFVDYFLFNEVVMNRDAGNLSTYLYKDLGGRMKLAVWDYNNAYNNYQGFESDFTAFHLLENSWFDRLIQDRAFVDQVVARYEQLRLRTFSEKHMDSEMAAYEAEIAEAAERNFAVWGYLFNTALMADDFRMIEDYEMGVDQLKTAINQRFLFLDQHIEDLYEYTIN